MGREAKVISDLVPKLMLMRWLLAAMAMATKLFIQLELITILIVLPIAMQIFDVNGT